VTSLIDEILKIGNKMIGNKATTGKGKASSTHQLIINTAMAKTKLGLVAREKGFAITKTKNNRTPVIKPSSFLLYSNHFFN
jgi:hypothetical protein